MKTRLYVLALIEVVDEPAEPVTVDTTAEPIPDSRPGLAQARPRERSSERRKVAVS